jgi:penicillin-binding protein 1A
MPIWQAAMNAATPSFGGGKLSQPGNVVVVPVCALSGQRATQFCQEYAEQPGSSVVKSHTTAINEYFRKGTEQLPFCTVHSGSNSARASTDMTLLNLPALDAVPVQPKAPALLGDDPYHTELPSFATTSAESGLGRRHTNVLDSLDLGDLEEAIPLRHPKRLEIEDE